MDLTISTFWVLHTPLTFAPKRCFGPATMITTIATTHHSPPRSHARFTESTPENIWETKLPPIVLLMACIIMASNTLPWVLLYGQVKTTVHAMSCTLSFQSSTPVSTA